MVKQENAPVPLVLATRGQAAPADAETPGELAYAALRTDIIEGHFTPNSRLVVARLCLRYGVSTSVMRSVLNRLVHDALVTVTPPRGFRVAPIALDDLEDLTRLRVHIETDALRQSIRQGDAAWQRRVFDAHDRLAQVTQPIRLEQRRAWECLNQQFHEALLSARPSPWTIHTLRMLARQAERYRGLAIGLTGTPRDVQAEHRAICTYALAGDEAQASRALEAHIWETPLVILRALRTGQMPTADVAAGPAR